METESTFIGIDISKATLDCCIQPPPPARPKTTRIANEPKAIIRLLSAAMDNVSENHNIILAMENTGRYNWPLFQVLANMKAVKVYVLCPLALKRSLGLVRGKSDQIDALRICSYIQNNYRKLAVWTPPSPSIVKLRVLLSEREARIKTIKEVKSRLCEYGSMQYWALSDSLTRLAHQELSDLQAQVKEVEALIGALVAADPALAAQAELVRSVQGAGKVLCWYILAKTEGFTILTEPRKMACMAGVAPYDYGSGTSIKARPQVSVYADKKLKSLLHMAALSAIRLKGELRDYYLRKVAEGKSKMSVINAVRNKIIHRIYAVVAHNQPYKP